MHQHQTQGFRAGAMYRKQDWYDVFEFSVRYVRSERRTPRTTAAAAVATVMPYFIGKIVETSADNRTGLFALFIFWTTIQLNFGNSRWPSSEKEMD